MAVLGHFAVQPSRYSQQMHAVLKDNIPVPAYAARLTHERGKSLEKIDFSKTSKKRKLALLDGLADAVADHLRLGVAHGDIKPSNIVVSWRRTKRRGAARPRVKLIDYELSGMLSGKQIEHANIQLPWDYGSVAGDARKVTLGFTLLRPWDYGSVVGGVIPHMAGKDRDERERLKAYFEKRFLRKIESRF